MGGDGGWNRWCVGYGDREYDSGKNLKEKISA